MSRRNDTKFELVGEMGVGEMGIIHQHYSTENILELDSTTSSLRSSLLHYVIVGCVLMEEKTNL